MSVSNNSFQPGDRVAIKRGEGWLAGAVVKTVLARCHIKIGERVFVEDYHNCRSLTDERITNS